MNKPEFPTDDPRHLDIHPLAGQAELVLSPNNDQPTDLPEEGYVSVLVVRWNGAINNYIVPKAPEGTELPTKASL